MAGLQRPLLNQHSQSQERRPRGVCLCPPLQAHPLSTAQSDSQTEVRRQSQAEPAVLGTAGTWRPDRYPQSQLRAELAVGTQGSRAASDPAPFSGHVGEQGRLRPCFSDTLVLLCAVCWFCWLLRGPALSVLWLSWLLWHSLDGGSCLVSTACLVLVAHPAT